MSSEENSDLEPEFGAQGYQYEPEYTEEEIIRQSNQDSAAIDEHERSHDLTWCHCGQCIIMPSRRESSCCQEFEHYVVDYISESMQCITQHHDFELVCLNTTVLETAYVGYMRFRQQHGRAPDFLTANDASTPTVLPVRPRDITFEVVDDIDDTNAQVLPSVQIGRSYFLRICFDRGIPYNPQADPFGIFVQTCSVSNIETFLHDDVTTFVQEFITYDATADTGCPITDGDITGPLYMNSDFKVRSDPTDFPAYTPTDAGFPQNKWCLYTDAITAARWNKFTSGALIDKLWFQCTVGFCTKFDHGATPSDADRCTDHCAAVKRRRRNIGNQTLPKTEEEVVYTSLTFRDSSEGQPSEVCAADSSDFTIAIPTVITLIILISAAILAAILVFRKLMNLTSRLQKEKQFSENEHY